MKINPKYEGQFDDDRICDEDVSLEERCELEKKLIRMFAEKAAKEEKRIVFLKDHEEYKRLKESGDVFRGDQYYISVDEKGDIRDMKPLAYHLIDTKEGRFYAKIIVHEKGHPSLKH